MHDLHNARPTFVQDANVPGELGAFNVRLHGTNDLEGKFAPVKRKGMNKETEAYYINKHLADRTNVCLTGAYRETRMKMANKEVINFDRKYISDLPEPKDQRFYMDREGYQTFDTKMKARELKINLAKAKATSIDTRWKWNDDTRKEQLTKGMTMDLRLKIQTITSRDPEDKSQ